MTQLSKAQLLTDIATYIFTNEDEDITGDILAQRLKNIVDSFYNITDTSGEFIQQGSNPLTQNLTLDGDSTYNISVENADIEMNGNAINNVVIKDVNGNTIFDGRAAFKSSGELVLDLQNQYAYANNRPTIKWNGGTLNLSDTDNTVTADWMNKALFGGWKLYWRGDGTNVGDVRERWDEPTTSIITETFNGTTWDFRSAR